MMGSSPFRGSSLPPPFGQPRSGRSRRCSGRTRRASSGRCSRSLVLELLEERTLLATLNITSTGALTYTAGAAVVNNLTVSLNGGIYTFNDTAETISLKGGASANCEGRGTNTITCPDAAITSININVSDANDTVNLQSVGDPTTVNGGTGTGDRIAVSADANFILANTSLTVSTFPVASVVLAAVEVANLTGGGGSNSFTLTGWSGTGALDGQGGSDTVTSTNNANFTLSNASLGVSGAANLALASIEVANLTGGSSPNTFTVSGWTGTGTLNGQGGNDTVVAANDANFTLTNTSLVVSSGASLTLASIEVANLTGGPSDNTFTVSGWTGTGTLDGQGGTDVVVAASDADITVTATTLTVSGGGSFTLVNVEGTNVTGGVGNNNIDVSQSTSSVTVDGGGGEDTITGGSGNAVLFGGAGNDVITATGGTPTLFGGDGNDFMTSSSGSPSLFGDLGDDTMLATGGTPTLFGGSGNDVMTATGGTPTLFGGSGNDSMTGTGGSPSLFGDLGDDTMLATGGTPTLFGGNGNDSMTGSGGSPSLFGDLGDDTMLATGGTPTLFGGNGNDSMTGSGGSPSLFGDLGDDTMLASGGTPTLFGGSGNDVMTATGGTPSLFGGDGNDTMGVTGGATGTPTLFGDLGDDTMVATGGSPSLFGGGGNDMMTGTGGTPTLFGGSGNDSMTGTGGSPSLFGDLGDDTMLATGGTPTLFGGSGNDSMTGAGGSPSLFGDLADDTAATGDDVMLAAGGAPTLFGGSGNDSMTGAGGSPSLFGGSGNDTMLATGGTPTLFGGSGNDQMTATGGTPSLFGGDGNDTMGVTGGASGTPTLFGDLGDDTMLATGGTPSLFGGSGNDSMTGTGGSPSLFGGGGNDTMTATGGSPTLYGEDGDDSYSITGTASYPIAVAVDETGGGTGIDLLDFSHAAFSVTVDLSLDAGQVQVIHAPDKTLAITGTVEDVIGSAFSDFIAGNDQNNKLMASDGLDLIYTAGANDSIQGGISQVVYLDFDSETNTPSDTTVEHVYTAVERDAIQDRMEADYALFTNFQFTQVPPGSGQFVTIFFNKAPFFDDQGQPQPGGSSDELDFRNLNPGGTAAIDVNGFLGPGKSLPDTSENFIALSATIAAHELGHLVGLLHGDAFGAIGSGIFPGIFAGASNKYLQDRYRPAYPGPLEALEPPDHLMSSPLSVATSLSDAAGDPFFGEREAINLAFAVGGSVVTEQAPLHGSIATAQALSLVNFAVPNTLVKGINAGKLFDVSATDVVGSIGVGGEADVYSFNGQAGQLFNLQVLSNVLTRIGNSIDSVLRVFDSLGNLVPYFGTTADCSLPAPCTADDTFESQDSAVIDVVLPSTDTYFVEVSSFCPSPLCPAFNDTGDYELFIYSFAPGSKPGGNTMDTLLGAGGDDLLVGSSGADLLNGGPGSDVMNGGAGDDTYVEIPGSHDVVTDSGGTDSLDFSGAPLAITVDLSISDGTPQTVDGALNTVAINGIIENVIGSAFADLITGNAANNFLDGRAGNDTLGGGLGDDTFTGGTGVDSINGGAGVDAIVETRDANMTLSNTSLVIDAEGTDALTSIEQASLTGGAGNNTINVSAFTGMAVLRGLGGNDTLIGGSGGDVLIGDDGADSLSGGVGNDKLDGGADDDVLVGEAGSDILLGGTGADTLTGSADSDLLIGGFGADRLVDSAGDDLLIAGATAYDAVDAALRAIMAEWTSGRNYTTRVQNLRDGTGSTDRLNGSFFLVSGTTVFDDLAVDRMTGGAGLDWYFVGIDDEVTDLKTGEQVN